MRIVIIEDEPHADQRLANLILELIPEAVILAKIDSVKRSVQCFAQNKMPDRIFREFQLAEGLSFQICEQCEIKSPVIYTTAYEEYALKAFKVNSIDYILNPVDKDELQGALKKLGNLSRNESGAAKILSNINEAV